MGFKIAPLLQLAEIAVGFCTFRFLIVVTDEILYTIKLQDLEEYAFEMASSFENIISGEFQDVVESYRSIGLIIAITICDVRKNILCTAVKPV